MDKNISKTDEISAKVSKNNSILIILSSLLISIIYRFSNGSYFLEAIVPFVILLFLYLFIFKDEYHNKKAYYLLIPIFLIMVSDLVIGIDYSNKNLNIIILPVLLTIFIFSLLNKNYKLKENFMFWIFKLVPSDLIDNLKYFKIKNNSNDNKTLKNIFFGILLGGVVGIIILSLLVEADDYFKVFVDNIKNDIFNFNINSIIIFIVSFILSFSIYINILKNKETKMTSSKINEVDKTIVISFLGVINFVFILFIISEVSRLTVNFLQIPLEYTYSSYAREGFFQLLGVTFINFIVIMFLIYKTKLMDNNGIKYLVTMLLIFSIFLIFNSYYRMYLYINHFGFTVLRMQVVFFLLMELIIFILLILKSVNKFKKNNSLVYFIIMLGFYIINLYVCNNTVIDYIQGILYK